MLCFRDKQLFFRPITPTGCSLARLALLRFASLRCARNKMIHEAQRIDDDGKDNKKRNFSKELKIFEITLERTENVSKLHQALKTIIPTSVEAERTFSAAGLFLTKIRSRMANKNLNALATLRTHFSQK